MFRLFGCLELFTGLSNGFGKKAHNFGTCKDFFLHDEYLDMKNPLADCKSPTRSYRLGEGIHRLLCMISN